MVNDMNNSTITTILFDLDVTLLPFNEALFMEGYLSLVALKFQEIQINEEIGIEALFNGFDAMKKNDGSKTNETVFWEKFLPSIGNNKMEIKEFFIDFYRNEFAQLSSITYPNPISNKIVKTLKAKGYRLVLATTPVFPREGTLERMRWAGIDPQDFEIITTYESYCFSKPNVGYYNAIFSELGVTSNEVLMIGNDIEEDGAITQTGARCIFVSDHLIVKDALELKDFEMYSLLDLQKEIENFPVVGI